MRTQCPSCPDGNEWTRDGPSGRACGTCHGDGFIGDDDDDDNPYCECGASHTIEELDSGQCDACGKVCDE